MSGSEELDPSAIRALKLSLHKHLTWKTFFLLALMSAKQISELHGFSSQVHHSKGWRSYTFSFLPDFVAKTQNPSVYDSCFMAFTVPSLADFVEDDSDKMLLYLVITLKKYLSRKEQFRPKCSAFFISMTKWKK